jgi:preprotein translocase SecE subunit
MQHRRQVLLIFLACAALVGATVQAAGSSAFEQFAIADTRVLGLVNISTLIAMVAGVLTFVGLTRRQDAVTYADETVDELKKVTWPSRDEAVRGATTVVLSTLFIASLVAAYDLLWKNLADVFLFSR